MSTIWIINQYASSPATGVLERHRHFARELTARGHRVYLIAARWHHLLRDGNAHEVAPEIETVENFKFVRISVPRYAHAHDKRRLLNWLLFSWRLRSLPQRIPDPPDTIMYSSPSLFGSSNARRLAQRVGARFVFEVRDIWPLTLIEMGQQSRAHPIIRWMQRIEDAAYRDADRVVSNLPGAADHMRSRGMDAAKFSWIPNGISLVDVQEAGPLPIKIRRQLPEGKFVVGYTGTMGLANALDNLLSTAEILRDNEDIVFVLVGEGREKGRLQAEARTRGLNNVLFLDAVPKSMIQPILALFNVCFIGWNKSPLYRFGIAANKIFDYLYSGRPIIHSFSGSYDPVAAYGAGFTVDADDPAALAKAILKLYALPVEERRRMGENGRRAALENHEYRMLAQKLEDVLLG